MILSRIIALVLFLCATLPGSAQETPKETDFTAGFEKLAALGLPPIDSTAVWTRVSNRDAASELGNVLAKLKGSGWIIPAVGDARPTSIALGDTRANPVGTSKKDPSPADLAADVGTLIGNLRRLSSQADPDYSDRWVQESGSEYGRLLIFATQLHQSGHSLLANQLVTAIFQLVPDREPLIDAAVSAIAGPLWDEATTAALKSGDWAAYQRSAEEIVTRFPRGWKDRAVIENLILPQLKKQAAGEKPAVPSLPGITLDPAALEIVTRLEIGEADDKVLYLPWLLDDESEPDSPLQELAALGIEALPVLAATVDDPFLLKSPASDLEQYSHSYFSGDESPEDLLIQLYNNLHRPATRGELARTMLEATLPAEESDSFSSDSTDSALLSDRALAFWKEHQNSSREELALAFLESSEDYHQNVAADILANSTDPSHHEKIEATILNSESLLSQIELATAYVRIRKTAAKPFVDEFTKNARLEYESADPDDLPWSVREAGSVESLLKPLIALSTGKSARAMARDIGRGDPAVAEAAIGILKPLLAELEPKPHLHALLEGAFAAKDASVREQFLLASFSIDWDPDADEDEEETPPQPDRTISEAEANVWKKLIADERPTSSDDLTSYGVTNIRHLAALAMESSVVPYFFQISREASKITGISAADFSLTRAEARLSGQPVPQLPDASKVTPERLAEIVNEVASLPPTEIQPHLAKLSHDEQAAWRKWMWEKGDLPSPPALKAHNFTILAIGTKQDWTIQDEAISGMEPGFKLTRESVAAKIDEFAKDAPARSRSSMFVSLSQSLPGLETVSFRPVLPDPDKADEEDADQAFTFLSSAAKAVESAPESTVAAVHAMIYLERERAEAVWHHEADGSVKPADPEAADAFFNLLETAIATEDLTFFRFQILVLSREDAAKLNLE